MDYPTFRCQANLEILEQTRNIQTEIKVIQQRSLQYKREINETRRDYENIITKLELLRSRLLELSGYKGVYDFLTFPFVKYHHFILCKITVGLGFQPISRNLVASIPFRRTDRISPCQEASTV